MLKTKKAMLLFFSIVSFCALSSQMYASVYTGIAFSRRYEPREKAFSILVPKGWLIEGGVFRVNPLLAGGPLNSMEAKCDLTIKSDKNGTVAFHLYPDVVYAHIGIAGGSFPAGGNYQGAEVKPFMDAKTFVFNFFRERHAAARSIRVLKIAPLPGEKQALDQGLSYMNKLFSQIGMPWLAFKSYAAGGVFEYEEKGITYREVMLTGIVDMRASMTWKNTRTLSFKAPADAFERWKPIMDIIRFSISFNPVWVLKEMHGQKERANTVLKVFEKMREIDRQIAAKSKINRTEIMNDNFLVMTGQEEYVDPHTGEIELDTDAFTFRWKTPQGDIYYTNKEDENPNIFLHETGYRRTKIRKRSNE